METAGTPGTQPGDIDRPGYHFRPFDSWINDPKPFFADGTYHVYFQYSPGVAYSGTKHWGHAVSRDLAHWEELPIALSPTPEGPDADGCWTGCVVGDPEGGRFYCLYTGVRDLSRPDLGQSQCLAVSTDLVDWEKYAGNPVIGAEQKPDGFGYTFRDPCAWREGGDWRCVVGGNKPVGDDEFGEGAIYLYRSADLHRWEYLHPLYVGTAARDECPDFFPLDGPNGRRWVLITSRDETAWAVGSYDGQHFVPQTTGTVDDWAYYAAKTLVDDSGRRILFGWIKEDRPERADVEAGWSGVIALPRVLTLRADDTLGFEPAPELVALRRRRLPGPAAPMKIEPHDRLVVATGDRAEVSLRCAPGAADGLQLSIYGTPALGYDRRAGTFAGRPLDLSAAEPLDVTLFIDHSVIELFANGRVAKTARIYRDRSAGSGELTISANRGGVQLESIDVWALGKIGDVPDVG